MTTLAQYERARTALAEATRVDQVMPILNEIDHVKLHAKHIRDRKLLIEATVFQARAERRLGEVIAAAKEEGHLTQGHRAKSSDGELLSRATLAEVGVDKKLSSRAQKFAALPEDSFEAMLDGIEERVRAGAATVIDKQASTQEKKTRRASRERVLGAIQSALPDQRFGVIVADPEWRFEPWSRATGMDRAADNHYPTSCTEVIAARDVPSIAADDCVLFLWGTAPMLPHALAVMSAWGFDYKSHAIWAKETALDVPAVGTGYWFRNCHELLLVGTRGKIPAPTPGTQELSVIHALTGAHSEKPECVLEMIEYLFPTLPKIELNRRGPPRSGWAAWGNEAETENAAGEIGTRASEPAASCQGVEAAGSLIAESAAFVDSTNGAEARAS